MTDDLPPDSIVGCWLVRQCIGRGNHGTVFRVVHKDRPDAGSYALKVARKAGDERFEREVHLLSRVHHPSVPRLVDHGRWKSPRGEEYPYLVMQWVEGISPYAWAVEHGLVLRHAISNPAFTAPKEAEPHLAPAAQGEQGTRLTPAGTLILMVLLGVLLTRDVDRSQMGFTEAGCARQGVRGPDSDPSGLGEEGLASVKQDEPPLDAGENVTREVPTEPLPGQRVPPCPQRGVVVINGGCWRLPSIEALKAPCDSDLYEHSGRCYMPIWIAAKRVPTSKDPQ
ncbi:MAG TPA: phosphotransferase [Myxococcaceae bacterium]|jgi:hypothetical protein